MSFQQNICDYNFIRKWN